MVGGGNHQLLHSDDPLPFYYKQFLFRIKEWSVREAAGSGFGPDLAR
ncbi:MAG: hypothetical protein IH612_01075 [Desulfofustis sp.]|nr:hypothetical protein [Desulfofustis sp.]